MVGNINTVMVSSKPVLRLEEMNYHSTYYYPEHVALIGPGYFD